MNSLDRDIEPGEAIVIHERFFKEEFKHIAWRIHEAGGGFGAKDFTTGTYLAVRNLADGEELGVNALFLDPEETAAFQEKYGKDGSGWKDRFWAKSDPKRTPPEVDLG